MATNSHFSDFTDRRRKIPNLDPPTGIFGNHRRRLFKYEFVSLDPRLESRKSAMDISFTLGSNEEADHVKILQSCNGLLLCIGSGSHAFYYVYNPFTNMSKRLPPNSHDDSILHATGVFRWPLILQNHVTTKWCNFLHAYMLNLKFKFTLQRQAIGACAGTGDDIESEEFTIYEMAKGCPVWTVRDDLAIQRIYLYEMMKGYSVWSVRYLVNIEQLMNPLLEGWSIRTSVWSICLVEEEEDAFVVINLSGKVAYTNLISKTNTEIFDIGSNQMDDDDDADDAVLFIPPFEVDPNLYEFIPSLASVRLSVFVKWYLEFDVKIRPLGVAGLSNA
ncbi:hypothetical protein Tco_0205612 [Tanacetum coccineum]